MAFVLFDLGAVSRRLSHPARTMTAIVAANRRCGWTEVKFTGCGKGPCGVEAIRMQPDPSGFGEAHLRSRGCNWSLGPATFFSTDTRPELVFDRALPHRLASFVDFFACYDPS